MIAYRCNNHKYKGNLRCAKRVSMREKDTHTLESMRCPRCKKFSLVVDNYRMTGRKIANKDHPEACLCHGVKSKKAEKIVHHDGVRIVQGVHRKGQAGCIHAPDYGTNAFDDGEDEQPPF